VGFERVTAATLPGDLGLFEVHLADALDGQAAQVRRADLGQIRTWRWLTAYWWGGGDVEAVRKRIGARGC
jgi:hypothetical protein